MFIRATLCTAAFVGLTFATLRAAAQDYEPRQKYSSWSYHPAKKYHYVKLEYKVAPADTAYDHQYVVFYRDDPIKKKWVYVYNPKSEKFWARYPTVHHPEYAAKVRKGVELWSVLPPGKACREIDHIDVTAYSVPGATCPPIPGCKSNTPLLAPPADLP